MKISDFKEASKPPVQDDIQPLDDLDADLDGGEQFDQQSQDQLDQDAQDPNSMVKRYVKGAHLVYKRATSEGSFEELWIYQSGDIKDDVSTRKAILDGTDIEAGSDRSADGTQSCETWTAGNAQMLFITGLPN